MCNERVTNQRQVDKTWLLRKKQLIPRAEDLETFVPAPSLVRLDMTFSAPWVEEEVGKSPVSTAGAPYSPRYRLSVHPARIAHSQRGLSDQFSLHLLADEVFGSLRDDSLDCDAIDQCGERYLTTCV